MTGRAYCPRCEILPEKIPQGSLLHLEAPLNHTLGTIQRALHDAGIHFRAGATLITVPLDPLAPEKLAQCLRNALSSVERSDVHAFIEEPGDELTLAKLSRVTNLDGALARLQADWLIERLRNGELRTAFQPIFEAASSPDPGTMTLFGHECLLRLVDNDGGIHSPTAWLHIARCAGLQYQADLAARRTALLNGHRSDAGPRLFINFMASSIYNPAYCLQSTVDTVHELGIAPSRIVFEVIESERIDDMEHLRRILDYHRQSGFQVALDDLGAGFASLTLLDAIRPDYIKLDQALLHDVDQDPFRATLTSKILETAHALGIRSVAEGIETEAAARWVTDHGADLVQGHFFAPPAFTPWAQSTA